MAHAPIGLLRSCSVLAVRWRSAVLLFLHLICEAWANQLLPRCRRDILNSAMCWERSIFFASGPVPYPELGRARVIAGWGDSMGACHAHPGGSPRASYPGYCLGQRLCGHCAFAGEQHADPGVFIPSVLLAMRVLYGIDFYATRPVDMVARIAPRPIFFIQGTADRVVPSSNLKVLAAAASSNPQAHVLTWQVQGSRPYPILQGYGRSLRQPRGHIFYTGIRSGYK